MDNWSTFCDFPEISHIAIQGIKVCISRQDNMSMVNSLVKLYLVSIFCVRIVRGSPTYIWFPGHAIGLQSSGSLSGFTARWIFPPYNRRTSLSLSWSGSTQSGSQWDQWPARSHTVRHSHLPPFLLYFYILFYYVFTLFLALRDEFVLQKLKKEAEEGAFIVRWSVLDYHRIILASLSRTKVML